MALNLTMVTLQDRLDNKTPNNTLITVTLQIKVEVSKGVAQAMANIIACYNHFNKQFGFKALYFQFDKQINQYQPLSNVVLMLEERRQKKDVNINLPSHVQNASYSM